MGSSGYWSAAAANFIVQSACARPQDFLRYPWAIVDRFNDRPAPAWHRILKRASVWTTQYTGAVQAAVTEDMPSRPLSADIKVPFTLVTNMI